MGSYDYLWWDNSQLHKDGGCGAASLGACECKQSCMHWHVCEC